MKKIFHFVLAGLMIVLMNSCSKDDNDSQDNPLNGKTTAVFNPNVSYGTMTDQDGNVYKTVTIGTQIWMAENLRTTKYNDGTTIPNVTNDNEWEDLTTGAYCNYNNTTSEDIIATYGRLYNWYAVNTRKLAPKGWHVATDAEWKTLTTYLGGASGVGIKLKESGTSHWVSPNMQASNESGFTALPSGGWFPDGSFNNIGSYGYWWCSTEYNEVRAYIRVVWYGDNSVPSCYIFPKQWGLSVRCVKN